jgi:hypothetical protein
MAVKRLFRSVERKTASGQKSALLVEGVRDRIIIAATALLLRWPVGGVAWAAESNGDRVVVELTVTASLPDEQAVALSALIESQLPAHGLQLRLERGVTDVRRWLARESDDALLRVALDTAAVGGWRLLLVDVTRGRASARTLTGGVRRDRAAIEAVCDIVVSAAVALREGLEVASQTVDEVLTEAAKAGAPPTTPIASAPVAVSRSEPLPSSRFGLRVEAGAGPALATFARAAPASWGVGAAISVWHEGVGLEVSAARYLSQTFTATDGSFAIDRTQVGLSAEASARWRRARFSGSLGLLLEILQRGDASPAAANVATTAPDAAVRLGPEATATLGLSVSRRVAVAWTVGLGYFPRRIEYLSTAGSDAALTEPWPLTGISAVRVGVAFP